MQQPISCYPATLYGQEVIVRRFAAPVYQPEKVWELSEIEELPYD